MAPLTISPKTVLDSDGMTTGTVRVRNRAVAINFHDIQSRRHGEAGLEPPFVPGTDFAGVVDAVGEGVEGIAEGDRILGIQTHGAYAEATLRCLKADRRKAKARKGKRRRDRSRA